LHTGLLFIDDTLTPALWFLFQQLQSSYLNFCAFLKYAPDLLGRYSSHLPSAKANSFRPRVLSSTLGGGTIRLSGCNQGSQGIRFEWGLPLSSPRQGGIKHEALSDALYEPCSMRAINSRPSCGSGTTPRFFDMSS